MEPAAVGPGAYRLRRAIGKGAFGEVFLADGPGGVPVAVRRLTARVPAAALERERQSLDLICSGQLRHPFLLQVFGWWHDEGRLHLAMELADGSLEDEFNAADKAGLVGVPVGRLRPLMLDAAEALDFLNHRQGILHRDVKPGNLLLMAGRLKLADFGLARTCERLAIAAGDTFGAGTPAFLAPEVIDGHQSLFADQYGLAATYALLRTGRPVVSGTAAQMRAAHRTKAPELDEGLLRPDVRDVLRRALAKDPARRFPTSAQFVKALLAAEPAAEPERRRPTAPPTAVPSVAADAPTDAAPLVLPGGVSELSDPDHSMTVSFAGRGEPAIPGEVWLPLPDHRVGHRFLPPPDPAAFRPWVFAAVALLSAAAVATTLWW